MKKDSVSQDLIEKYIYDIIRRLPLAQRRDIEMELRTIIEDMMEDSEEQSTEEILKELGTPSELARKYRGSENYLIGPEYYEQYCFVLKIVLICSLAGMIIGSIVNFIGAIGNVSMTLSDIIEQIIRNITEPIISFGVAFSIVTIIFAFIENQKLKVDLANEKEWNPLGLPEIPNKKALLSRGEAAFNLIFSVVIFGVFTFAPQFIGAWVKEGEQYQTIPIFNLDIWNAVYPFFLIWFVLCLIDAIVKLVVGKYGITVALTNGITDFLSLGVAVVIFKYFPIWNLNFVKDIEVIYQRNISSKGDILHYWGTDTISNLLLGTIFIVIIIDVGITLYKSIRYGNFSKE